MAERKWRAGSPPHLGCEAGKKTGILGTNMDLLFPLPPLGPHPGQLFKEVKKLWSRNDSIRPAGNHPQTEIMAFQV